MPKTGPTDSQWAQKIKQYAAREFVFTKGQHPAKYSKWGIEKEKIDNCPMMKSGNGTDLFGRVLQCSCGHHKVVVPGKTSTSLTKSPTLNRRFRHNTSPLSTRLFSPQKPSTSTTADNSSPKSQAAAAVLLPTVLVPSPVINVKSLAVPACVPCDETSAASPAITESTVLTSSVETTPPTSPVKSGTFDLKVIPSPSSAVLPQSPSKTRQLVEFANRLPKGWTNIAPADKQWIGKYIFSAKGILTMPLRNWYYPPTVTASIMKPDPAKYFLRNFYLWMPRKMWDFQFSCPVCRKALRSRGVYGNVRRVLDLEHYYYIATEYLDCICGKAFIGWDDRLLNQLPYATRSKFPASLTHKYAVDKSLLTLLRSRTLGNSPSSVQNSIAELHSENWMRRSTQYMQDCQRHSKGVSTLLGSDQIYPQLPNFAPVPSKKWFLTSYTLDVLSRIETLKGNVTSVFGRILKIDSTKKIVKKLAGLYICLYL